MANNMANDTTEPFTSARKFIHKNESVVVSAVAAVTGTKVAKHIGDHDASYISRFLSGEQKISFPELLAMFQICDLVVYRLTENNVVITKREYDSLCFMASQHAKNL